MTIIPILLFVISSSLDNFAVAFAYGVKNIKIGFLSNLVIALISSLGTFLSMSLGVLLLDIFSLKSANMLGAAILLFLGIYFILDFYKSKKIKNDNNIYDNAMPTTVLKSPEIADIDKSGSIDFKESFILAAALALNNIALGITASIAGLSISLTTIFTFIFSLILIPLGIYLSKRFIKSSLGSNAGLFSGLLILLLSIIEFFK